MAPPGRLASPGFAWSKSIRRCSYRGLPRRLTADTSAGGITHQWFIVCRANPVQLRLTDTRREAEMKARGIVIIGAVILLPWLLLAQKPVAELPRAHIDTTWSEPTGGKVWSVHSVADFTNSLEKSSPGDVIVLDAGMVYTGNFRVPAKANPNNKWIYVTSSAYGKLPKPGNRVSPSDAENMPKIVTPAPYTAIGINESANHWRFVGIEVYSASTFAPKTNPPGVYSGYTLINNTTYPPVNLPEWIT